MELETDFRHHPGKPYLESFEHYKKLYEESIKNPDSFWAREARDLLYWDQDFTTVQNGGFEHGDVAWFLEGQLNASYNAVDRHALKNPNKPAIIYESDEPGQGRTITYGELLREVSRVAAVLYSFGVRKGDTVAVYLPMIPEVVVTLLAIVRLGAIHTVVFAGFSAGSLRDRILDADARVVITADHSYRG